MARRSKRKSLAVGVVGAGKTSAKALKQHLSDFIESQDSELTWVLPFTDNNSKTMEQVIDFLYNEEATYELVADGSVEDEDLYGYSAEFIELEEGEDSHMGVLVRVGEHDESAGVLILLDESLDADLDLVEAAQEEKLDVFDLCTALAPLTLEDAAKPAAAEEPEDATPVESDEDAPSASGVDMPDDVLTAISAGDVDEAVALLKALDKDDLVELAEDAGLAGPAEGDDPWKGIHRKTIAADLVGVLAEGGDEPEEPADEPEEEETPPPAAKKRASKRTAPKAKDPESEDEPEPIEDESDAHDVLTPAVGFKQAVTNGNHEPIDRNYLISVLSGVYIEKGLAETKKFYSLLEEKELV